MLVSWLLEKLHARANTLTGLKTSQSANASVLTTTQDFAQSRRDLAIKFIDDERYAEAEGEYRFLIDNNLSMKSDYVSLGFVFKVQNKLGEARKILESVLDQEESKADVHYMLASVYALKGLDELAVENFDAALKRNSQLRPAYLEYSDLLIRQEKFDLANEVVTLGLIHFSEDIDFIVRKANICVFKKKFETAIEFYRKIVGLDHSNLQALRGLCVASQELHQYQQALEWLDMFLLKSPSDPVALHQRGKILNKLCRFEESANALKQALELGQNNSEFFIDMGCALSGLGHLDSAMEVFAKVTQIEPESVLGYLNSGAVAYRRGRHIDSLELLKNAEKNIFLRMTEKEISNLMALPMTQFSRGVHPEHYATVQYSKSFGYLTLGDFSKGFQAYEWRWNVDQFKSHRRNLSSELWLGHENIAGKSILLYAEQGLGDTLQFVRYVQMVKTLGANVLLEVQPTLKQLLAKSTGADEIYSFGETLPATDFHCPLMSLPLAFNTSVDTIPSDGFSLNLEKISKIAVSEWEQKFSDDGKKRVGLAWSGNKDYLGDQFRSIPFDKFKKILSKKVNFYSLQKEVRANDKAVFAEATEIIDFSAEFLDFLDTAALIFHLDLVITVDTAIAHLAASMKKPVWILIPFSPDWRWLLDRSDSPWYPSVSLFRQTNHDNWDDVIDTVVKSLETI